MIHHNVWFTPIVFVSSKNTDCQYNIFSFYYIHHSNAFFRNLTLMQWNMIKYWRFCTLHNTLNWSCRRKKIKSLKHPNSSFYCGLCLFFSCLSLLLIIFLQFSFTGFAVMLFCFKTPLMRFSSSGVTLLSIVNAIKESLPMKKLSVKKKKQKNEEYSTKFNINWRNCKSRWKQETALIIMSNHNSL